MTAPAPRPALRRAPDANVHPAAPGGIPSGVAAAAQVASPLRAPVAQRLHRLSAPPRGNTSDSMRTRSRPSRAEREQAKAAAKAERKLRKEKKVELTVKLPKSLRKDLRAAAKSAGRTPDEVVTSLIRSWIDN